MEFENQIKRYPGCKNCDLVKQAEANLRRSGKCDNQHIVLTQCAPKLGLLDNSATMIGMITDVGRLAKLQASNRNESQVFQASMIQLTEFGNCDPLIDEVSRKVTNKVLKVLHLG